MDKVHFVGLVRQLERRIALLQFARDEDHRSDDDDRVKSAEAERDRAYDAMAEGFLELTGVALDRIKEIMK